MKIPSICRKFLFAATAIYQIAQGRDFTQDPAPPLVKVESTLPDPRSSADNFFILFADPPGPNGSKLGGMSGVGTDILTLDYKLTPTWTGEIAFRTDWVNRKPGFMTSGQYEGLQQLDLQAKLKDSPVFKDTTLKFGTLFIYSPDMADPRFGGKPAMLNNFFLIGGGNPGLGGVRIDGTVEGAGITAKYTGLAGTGLRGLDGTATGAYEPSLCQGNTQACGLVAGGNVDVQTAALPGATLNTEVTHIGNGGTAHNEWRTTFGGKYTHEVGSGIAMTGAAETTHGTNYLGGATSLDATIGKISAEKGLGGGLTLQPYASVIDASGAVNKQFDLYGGALTYHKDKNTFSIEPYVGSPNMHGAVFKWDHSFHH